MNIKSIELVYENCEVQKVLAEDILAIGFEFSEQVPYMNRNKILKGFNQDAVVCHAIYDDENIGYSTFEVCREQSNVTYIDDSGQDAIGDIVYLF